MFTFKHTSEYYGQPKVETTVTTDAVSLSDILQSVEDFLRGSGYVFDGSITIVNEDLTYEEG